MYHEQNAGRRHSAATRAAHRELMGSRHKSVNVPLSCGGSHPYSAVRSHRTRTIFSTTLSPGPLPARDTGRGAATAGADKLWGCFYFRLCSCVFSRGFFFFSTIVTTTLPARLVERKKCHADELVSSIPQQLLSSCGAYDVTL